MLLLVDFCQLLCFSTKVMELILDDGKSGMN